MKRLATLTLALLCALLALAGCTPSESPAPAEKTKIRLAGMTGPTSIGLVKLLYDNDKDAAANDYDFTMVGTPDEITAGIINGSFDIAAVPCNLASVLYNNTDGKIKLLGINTLSVLYIVETGNDINTAADLRGKTIYTTGKGATPEMTLNFLLLQNGIDPASDVTIEFRSEAAEVAALLAEGDGIAMLPQPFVTTALNKNERLRVALDVSAEWDKISGGSSAVVTGVTIVRAEFLENNKAAVDAFWEEYTASAAFVNQNIDEAAELVGALGIVPAAVAKQAIPHCNIAAVGGDEMETLVGGYLTVLFEQNPKAVGGKLPDAGFYYKK